MSTRVMVNTDLATFTAARTDEDYLDNWPTLPDGTAWDGANLLALASRGQCPFRDWDIYTLVREIEAVLGTAVINIPRASFGANHYASPTCSTTSIEAPVLTISGISCYSLQPPRYHCPPLPRRHQ